MGCNYVFLSQLPASGTTVLIYQSHIKTVVLILATNIAHPFQDSSTVSGQYQRMNPGVITGWIVVAWPQQNKQNRVHIHFRHGCVDRICQIEIKTKFCILRKSVKPINYCVSGCGRFIGFEIYRCIVGQLHHVVLRRSRIRRVSTGTCLLLGTSLGKCGQPWAVFIPSCFGGNTSCMVSDVLTKQGAKACARLSLD